MTPSMLFSPPQFGPVLSVYDGWSPGAYPLRGGKITVMFSCRPGWALVPHTLSSQPTDFVSPLSRHGYSGEYLAKTPSTGFEVWASEMRLFSLVVRKLVRVSEELAVTVNVRRSCSF